MTWWIAGATVASAGIGYLSSDQAADEASRGNRNAIAEQRRQFDIIMGLQRPYSVTGTGALNMLARLYGIPYAPYQDPAGFGAGGGYGAHSETVGRSGLGDPLGLPDPLGIFGNSGRRADFAAGPGQAFTARQVSRMFKRGMTLEEIDKLGKLEISLNQRRLKKLQKRGLSIEDIQRLQYGEGNVPGEPGSGPPDIVTPTGPDMSVFTASPDYQFRQREGQAAIDRGAAARGGALSGNAIRAGVEHASDLASTEFGNFFSRLAAIAGIGQGAANTASSAAANTGNNVSSLLSNTGAARASGVLGQANSISNALNTGLNSWMLYRGGLFGQPGAG